MKGKTLFFVTAFILVMGLEKSFAGSPVVLLTINDSNPSAVTVTATGADSGANDSGKIGLDGVDLLAFFTQSSPSVGGPLANSTLQGGNLTSPYNLVGADTASGGGSVDLNLYVNTADPETFSTTQPAFTGSWTMDLSSFHISASALPAPGSSGQIISGFSGNAGPVIGEWQVDPVPEPATGSLLLMISGVGVVFWRRRASRNSSARQ